MRTSVSLVELLLRCAESQRNTPVLLVRPVINGRHEVVHLKSRRLLASSKDRVSQCCSSFPFFLLWATANTVGHCANVYRDFPEHYSRNKSVRKYQCQSYRSVSQL